MAPIVYILDFYSIPIDSAAVPVPLAPDCKIPPLKILEVRRHTAVPVAALSCRSVSAETHAVLPLGCLADSAGVKGSGRSPQPAAKRRDRVRAQGEAAPLMAERQALQAQPSRRGVSG